MAMSVSGDVPDKLPIPIVINMEVKAQLKKEIREFGGQYEKILKLLEGVQGPPELQRKFVIYAMKQAAKVQRQDLIGHLQEVLDKLELDHFLKKDTHTHNL
ncbi:Integrator complex subunit 6-like [Vulpes lagopus]